MDSPGIQRTRELISKSTLGLHQTVVPARTSHPRPVPSESLHARSRREPPPPPPPPPLHLGCSSWLCRDATAHSGSTYRCLHRSNRRGASTVEAFKDDTASGTPKLWRRLGHLVVCIDGRTKDS